MKNRGFRGVIGWAALLLLFFTQVAYGQEKCDFDVSGGNYSFSGNVLTVSGGDVTVSTSKETSQTIKLSSGRLILNGVKIKITSGSVSPIEVEGTAEIRLASSSENTLTSTTTGAAGIHVPPKCQVTFTGNGTLTVVNEGGGSASTGIGGKQGTYSCGTIIFDLDGTVTAKGGTRAAGIGTCMARGLFQNVSGNILIKQGTINSKGGLFSAGIGAGPDTDSGGGLTITIEGGTVNTTGGSCGIGPGGNCSAPIDIFLLGGTVTANIWMIDSRTNLKTVIVGPDVNITGDVTDQYSYGFVFSGTPNKFATVKGNPVFPADKKMTIDAGETLTIPAGTILTNNGTIINNGTIDGGGLILGNIPNNWQGNTAYITYNANGGKGAVADTYHKVG